MRVSRHVVSESVRDARRGTLRKRDASGHAIIEARHVARADLVAQQRQLRVLKTPDRRSARIQAMGGAKPLIFSPSDSTETASVRADLDYDNHQDSQQLKVPVYTTPLGNIFKDDRRPKPDDLAASFVSKDGILRCSTTGQSSKNGTVQYAHVVDRTISKAERRALETAMGLSRDKLSLDTRMNIVPLCMEIHRPTDLGHFILLPSYAVLSMLYKALNKKIVKDWDKKRRPKMNAKRFIHHEDVFPRDTLIDVHLCVTRRDGKIQRKYYEPPFLTPEGEPELPMVKLKCSPYFLAWKAFWALTKDAAEVAPRYLAAEVRQLKRVGGIIRACIDKNKEKNPFAP
ncbi:hypothetical protein HDZ31DRAFT_83784 [Schizophyllum fasciatum]